MKLNFLLSAVFFLILQLPVVGQSLKKTGDTTKGKASYYHSKFHGRKTASGERYDQFKLTAAHRTLPYGTMIKVTNQRNKKSVVVKVNDRGPYSKGRIVDLSFQAASLIDMVKEGVASVEVEIMAMPGEKTQEEEKPVAKKDDDKKGGDSKLEEVVKEATGGLLSKVKKALSKVEAKDFKTGRSYSPSGYEKSPKGYGIQIASYYDVEYALRVAKEAEDLDMKPIIVQAGWKNGRKIYRVLYGEERKSSRMEKDLPFVKSKGFSGFVAKHFD